MCGAVWSCGSIDMSGDHSPRTATATLDGPTACTMVTMAAKTTMDRCTDPRPDTMKPKSLRDPRGLRDHRACGSHYAVTREQRTAPYFPAESLAALVVR